MEFKRIEERVGKVNIEEMLVSICEHYTIGNYINHKIVEIGYEDFNIILQTNSNKYFVKVLNNDRTEEQCERLARIFYTANTNNVNSPKVYTVNNELIYKLNCNGKKVRILLLEYINGEDMYSLARMLNLEEIKQVAEQASIINEIDFNVPYYYDEWTITNFKKEYDKKINLIKEEDRKEVTEVYDEFIKLDVESLPKSYIHGDMINANLIVDNNNKIWVIDFSTLNYLPRAIELVVLIYGVCLVKNRAEFVERVNCLLSAYNKCNKLSELEIKAIPLLLKTNGAMSIMQASYIKETLGDFKENNYWLELGRDIVRMNLKEEEIKL